jgi:sRNA-binding regulator protein Hfq
MTFGLLSELHDIRIKKRDWKREALEFQRLMLENDWLHDLDVDLEHAVDEDGDEDILVHVKHKEFMDLSFHVSHGFRIDTPESSERYGDTALAAYKEAMPILIGMKAGFDLKGDVSLFDDFTLSIDGGANARTATLKFQHHSGTSNDAYFEWDIRGQGFKPVDEDNLPKNHGMLFTTVKGIRDYLESFDN